LDQWKLDKLRSLTDEVREVHPLLRAVFTNDGTISRFEYTHGTNEMGADFVLARKDPTLGDENYIGVVVKCGNIRQDHADVKRQIEECAVERFFDGAKRKIYLNETRIICNGRISAGAEKKIFEEYKSRNIKFIDLGRLAQIVDSIYPHFWNEIPPGLGTYLRHTLLDVVKAESYNTLGTHGLGIDVHQELYEVEPSLPGKKLARYNKALRTTLVAALTRHKLVMIEGGMGSGKTTLFRRHVKLLCEPETFQKGRVVPKIVHFSEIADDVAAGIELLVEEMQRALDGAEDGKLLLLLDGVDEVKSATDSSLVNAVEAISAAVKKWSNLSVAIGSRPVWTIEDGEELLRHSPRFRILPLTFEQVVKVNRPGYRGGQLV